MWSFAVIGMAIFGMPDSTILQSNDLHVLFIPVMTFYGLALVLVMWSRLEINIRLVRIGFLGLLYVVSALPFLHQFLQLSGLLSVWSQFAIDAILCGRSDHARPDQLQKLMEKRQRRNHIQQARKPMRTRRMLISRRDHMTSTNARP